MRRRYHFTVDLGHTAATILPSHALRVEVAGSSFPMFDRNLHTGEGPSGRRKQVCVQTEKSQPVCCFAHSIAGLAAREIGRIRIMHELLPGMGRRDITPAPGTPLAGVGVLSLKRG